MEENKELLNLIRTSQQLVNPPKYTIYDSSSGCHDDRQINSATECKAALKENNIQFNSNPTELVHGGKNSHYPAGCFIKNNKGIYNPLTGNSVGTYRDGIRSVCRKTKGEEYIKSNEKNIDISKQIRKIK